MKWYAVQRDREDVWDNGSFDYDEAVAMLKAQGEGLIAVIDDETKVCIDEIEYNEAVVKFQFEAAEDGNILWGEDSRFAIRASVNVPEGASEDYGYIAMKKAILDSLTEAERKTVTFWYDGQEQYLADDSKDGQPEVDVERF